MKNTNHPTVGTVKRSSSSGGGNSATAPHATTGAKKKKKPKGKAKSSTLKSSQAIAYVQNGEKEINPSKVCPTSMRKDITLSPDEKWHKVMILDMGEIK